MRVRLHPRMPTAAGGSPSSTQDHGRGGMGESRWNLPPITLPEIVAGVILMSLLVIVGLYPSIMLNMITPNVKLFLQGLNVP